MFFEKMSYQDIEAICKKEKDSVNRTADRLQKEFQKRYRKFNETIIHHRGFLHKTNAKNEFYTIITQPEKKIFYRITLPTYMTDKGRVYLFKESKGDLYRVMGPHFLKRYRDRHCKDDINLVQSLLHVTWDCRESITIYKTDEVQGMYGRVDAVVNGLIIGDVDTKKGIYYARTYVSDDMLQPIQRKAKEKIDSYLKERLFDYYSDFQSADISDYDILSASLNAQEIYKTYYSSAEDHIAFLVENCSMDVNLNFTLNRKSQKLKQKAYFDISKIPTSVQKLAGNKALVLGAVLEDTLPHVYAYFCPCPILPTRVEDDSYLYCPFSNKAIKIERKDLKPGSLTDVVSELQKKD